MKAFVYNGDKNFRIEDREKPSASKDTAVIKIEAASICGTDVRTYANGNPKITPGRIIGHECCGRIVEIGREVPGFALGDRVQIAPAIGCGVCRPCQKGHTNMCDHLRTIGFEFDGVFAEYMEIPADAFHQGNVNKVNEHVTANEAALAEPMACAYNAQQICNIKEGDTVAVFGSGFIGCSHAELAFAAGASKVMMMEVSDFRIRQARELIPDIIVINSKTENCYDRIMEETDGNGADVVITACSVGQVHTDALKIAAKHGRISLFGGIPGDGKGFLDSNDIHYKELGVFGVHASTSRQNREILEKISRRQLQPEKYITKEYPLEEILEAFEHLKAGRILKAIIHP
ncbi:alcohol dehydrogenase catalytic domain-containing protein [Robinsoniella peoriensis]|uniref:Putative zinc-type alcohol dehydrogenase-like protein YjmD n=1 Tax=Robinsoniella peoriensis TaxID=180332 RepID=A0A4U8Q114_9FIRM|nr:alcohol dehydrogenase catalytic domain-containing protein [Robinsoniella peoriensis]MDU7029024.1 alcohol dehydrogenase catalytic domain-containing protein [Clostridiales bacterium]TLC98340.1 putative zinc-type alcohol dehydrogenase-like protein YjmD [Robinsoniella peoriensis]